MNKVMDRQKFDCLDCFCDEVANQFAHLGEFEDISIIAKYQEAKEIIAYMIRDGFNIHGIEINFNDHGEYANEYIISLITLDNSKMIFCEPMKIDDKYIDVESTIIYVLDNCSSKVLFHCDGKTVYEVAICDDKCEDCDCNEDVEYSHEDYEDDKGLHTFTVSRTNGDSYYSCSFSTTENVNTDAIYDLLKRLCY